MRKNKLLSGVLAAVMAAALIPAMPADEISADNGALSGGSEFYTMPEDKSEPVKTGEGGVWNNMATPVVVEQIKKTVNDEEITEEVKYLDILLWESGDDWVNFKDLGYYALEVNVSTEDNMQFERAMVGSEISQFTPSSELIKNWQTSECEVNDNTIQFIGLGNNLVQSNYSNGQMAIRLVIPSDKAAQYVQGQIVKTTIDFAVYKAEIATSKWDYVPTMTSQIIKPADLASEAGMASETIEKIDFYSNKPIAVTYPSTEGTMKTVRACRVSLSDIDFSSTDFLTIATNPDENSYVPVSWKAYQKIVLSVNKQFTPLENGKYNERAVLEVYCPVVLNELDYINITFTYGKHKQTIKANKYYTVIHADNQHITMTSGYFFVIVTLTDIPDSIVPYEVDGKPAGLDISYELVYKSKT